MKCLVKKVVLILVFIPIQFLVSQHIRNIKLPEKGICAHRGAMNTHPENTIAAFEEAIRLGAHMIEFDVRMTKDGQLVIIHDESVDRTTNGSGLVKELTLNDIKKLDAGSWKSGKFRGEKIPTLTETLKMMPQNIWLNIHLKGDYHLGKETAKVLVTHNRLHQGVIACGSDAARGVADVNANIIICNMERQENRIIYVQQTIQEDFGFIQLLKKRNDDDLEKDVRSLKKAGINVNYFYGDTALEVKELFAKGVDFILTNELAEIMEVAESLGIERVRN